jgi:hypothetical protein
MRVSACRKYFVEVEVSAKEALALVNALNIAAGRCRNGDDLQEALVLDELRGVLEEATGVEANVGF